MKSQRALGIKGVQSTKWHFTSILFQVDECHNMDLKKYVIIVDLTYFSCI